MNYYKHNIGDYSEETAHLSFVEDAAYSRLIRKYYAREKALPADLKQVQRLVGARSKEEKIAVETVLEEFFYLDEDGWHQEKCDMVIADFKDNEPEREIKKANEETRMKRHREERTRLFSLLNQAGQHAPWNISMGELRTLAQRTCNVPATEPETPATPETPLHATAPATPATGKPRTINHNICVSNDTHAPATPETPLHANYAGEVCIALKKAGLTNVNPAHPDLLELIAAGARVNDFVHAACSMKQRETPPRNPFAYVLGVLKGQLDDAYGIHRKKPKGTSHDRHDVEEPA